jgi:23S rRNA (adenine2030-N6)-methyltransferase
MNYRHEFHAGNLCDVMKHAILAQVISYYKLKEKPFRVIDTHAGRGRYDLESAPALKTGEWVEGIHRLRQKPLTPALAAFLKPYLDVQETLPSLKLYGGSPEIAACLMRPQDKAIFVEREATEAWHLKQVYEWSQNSKVLNRDGYEALKALLPPPEKRAIILIDPPFEEKGEEAAIVEAMSEAQKRFPTGTYLIWYPIKERARISFLLGHIARLNFEKTLNVSLQFRPHDNYSLTGSGLLMINPPFALEKQIQSISRAWCEALNLPQGRIYLDKI